MMWVSLYNLGEKVKKYFLWLTLGLGLAFGVLFMIEILRPGGVLFKPQTIYLFNTISKNHNHLGDFWAIVLLITAYQIVKRRYLSLIALLIPGIYFLGVSQSRSAYVALLTGLSFLFWRMGWIQKYKKVFLALIILVVGLFLYSGLGKTVFFSRPYFEQAILGLYKYPFGVGVGNFSIISTDPSIAGGDSRHFTSIAHNIGLEMISGMGVLGLSFIFWLGYVLYKLFKKINSKNIVFAAIFLAVTANFMFDTTYFIPTMLWLWFGSLGMAQSNSIANR
jgi:O-antigen ligase